MIVAFAMSKASQDSGNGALRVFIAKPSATSFQSPLEEFDPGSCKPCEMCLRAFLK